MEIPTSLPDRYFPVLATSGGEPSVAKRKYITTFRKKKVNFLFEHEKGGNTSVNECAEAMHHERWSKRIRLYLTWSDRAFGTLPHGRVSARRYDGTLPYGRVSVRMFANLLIRLR